MCGIAGFMPAPGQTMLPDAETTLIRALAHRGPDGDGAFVSGDTTLLHTRLAIIDLATGDQPLRAGPLALTANGEIYNYRELKQEFSAPYKTQSDCEPILYIFTQRGLEFAASLRGMYGMALHDAAANTLTLARDLFGIKPLYYVEGAFGFAFASEPQALLEAGFATRGVDRAKLDELLNLQFTTGRKTIFPGICRVLPGETLTICEGKINGRQHLDFPQAEAAPRNEAEALARLDNVLAQSVEFHLRSDVPFGMFLSGGIDSAAILTMMARLSPARVHAYTAGFDVPGVADERDAAAEVANSLGAKHERLQITQDEVWRHLPEIAACMDDPAADYAIIPTWFLARQARADVKVILSGEGGDEMFAGYGRYRAATRPIFPKKMRKRGIFDGLDVLRQPATSWRDGFAASAQPTGTGLTWARRMDMADWLPHDLLLKLDRCLMAHGVEGRTPFVDREMAKFAFSLPDKFLVRHGQGKYLLRLWLDRHCPAARAFAPKQGFDVPIGAWIQQQGRRLGELVARQPLITEIAKPDRVVALFEQAGEKRAGHAAWTLLFTALWHTRHGLGRPAGGDTFETLVR